MTKKVKETNNKKLADNVRNKLNDFIKATCEAEMAGLDLELLVDGAIIAASAQDANISDFEEMSIRISAMQEF